VNNAFLQGTLTEHVYMHQPPGFIDKDFPSHVCKLHKAIYGLKQAPHAWFHELKTFLLQSGFQNSHTDTSLFVLHLGQHLVYLLVYVDDLIITGDDVHLLNRFTNLLAHRLSLKDLGQLSYFLDIAYIVNKLSQFMHQPTTEHWVLAKRLLRYLCGTTDLGLQLHCDSPSSLHAFSDALHAYSDAD